MLPKENAPDLDDLPEEVRRRLSFHPVESLDEVLNIALVSPEATAVSPLVGAVRP